MTNEADSVIRTKASLCAGIGALDAAVPGQLQWYAEKEDAPSSIMEKEHPVVPNLRDMTTSIPMMGHVDLLVSGDPCQSMSVAGRQEASGDERYLWPYVINAVWKVAPREVFLENVQNVRSAALVKGGEKGGVLKQRLTDLREAGYACRWTILGACAVGAPHHRHRWFLRGRYVGMGNAPEAVFVQSKCGAPRSKARVLLPTPNARDGGERGTPSVEHARRRIANPERQVSLEESIIGNLLPTPSAVSYGYNQGGASEDGPKRYSLESLGRMQSEVWGKFAAAVALWEEVTGVPAPAPTEAAPKGGRRLNAELSEWMMGYERGYLTSRMSRSEALKAAGNGVVTMQARAAWGMLAG